ncbi:hypothetical protein ON010_g3807 [Phytophthora cinnamomi]|nr:hypothetical protein ON010_g3807 [Phytophthora cinnamomi]
MSSIPWQQQMSASADDACPPKGPSPYKAPMPSMTGQAALATDTSTRAPADAARKRRRTKPSLLQAGDLN